MKQLQNVKKKSNTLIIIGIFVAFITYLISQTTLSIFLTESLNPINSENNFNFNLLYRIAENQWWNSILIMISLMVSLLISTILVIYKKRKLSEVH